MSDFASETGPDGRQRPRYGEYASPEEQRARIAQPDASSALDAGVAPDAVAAPPAQQAAAPSPGPNGPAAASAPTSARRSPDRIVTIVLLAYGAVSVVLSVFSYLDLASVAERAFEIVGVPGEFTNYAAARLWGPIAAVVLVVGYLVTFWFAVRRLRAGRLSWWVPLTGAVVTYIVVYVCLAIPLVGDPAFAEYAGSLS